MLTARMFQLQVVEAQAGRRVVRAGQEYFALGATRVIQVAERSAQVTVKGSAAFPYWVTFRLQGAWLQMQCTCPHARGGATCKHMVAAILAMHAQLTAEPPNPWRLVLDQTLRPPRRRTAALLVFSLVHQGSTWTLTPYLLPTQGLAALDPPALAKALRAPQQATQARVPRNALTGDQVPAATPAALTLANLLIAATQFSYYGASSQVPATLAALLPLLPDEGVFTGSQARPFQAPLQRSAAAGVIGLHGTTTPAGLVIAPCLQLGQRTVQLTDPALTILLPEQGWALVGAQLVPFTDPSGLLASWRAIDHLTIPSGDEAEFLERYLGPLAAQLPLTGDLPGQEMLVADAAPRLYLQEADGTLQVALRFGYGPHELAYDPQQPATTSTYQPDPPRLVQIERQQAHEGQAWQTLLQHGLKRGPAPGVATLRASTTPAAFLLSHVPQLAAAGFTIYGEETVRAARVNRHPPTLRMQIASGVDWFDLAAEVLFGETPVDLATLRQAIRRRERYVKLADGSIGELPPEWLARYRHLFALGEVDGQQLRLQRHQAALLDDLTDELAQAAGGPPSRQALQHLLAIAPQPTPPGFIGTLRPYQQTGVAWLMALHAAGLGGCLADDMGTGKTIQTLALLQAVRASGHATAPELLVMPRSLLFNWQRELARWTPDLRVLVHADAGRATTTDALQAVDVVLTTYGTVLRDLDLLVTQHFHYVVLDEAQAIKNPAAQTARAVRALQSDHRLTLTGTPVENRTLELWSQFAFLNPGMLGSLDTFRTSFAVPIEQEQDAVAAERLRRLVAPFLLRRTKAQVAPELPPRQERVLTCTMEPAQQKLYARYRDRYRAQLLQLIDAEGMQDARMQVLEGLLRLRQLCNHPRLVEPAFRGRSAKFELLLETLETLQAEGHKALIFSQFVQMLALVRAALEARGIGYAYLDGQTRQRAAAVDRFQTDPSLSCFLISLKAGGVGLNLTAADYVIHIDPWWNPAVEQQATDRSHRIGQDKPVLVTKLIVQETVEEKLLALQERKRALAAQLIASEPGIGKQLTRADVELLFS